MSTGARDCDLFDGVPWPTAQREAVKGLLQFVVSSSTATRLADQLMDRFGSVSRITSVSEYELQRITNVSSKNLRVLSAARELGRIITQEPLRTGPVINDPLQLYNYLRQSLAGLRKEFARVLVLDPSHHLLADVLHTMGTADRIEIYPREVVRAALDWNGSGVILVHNHPANSKIPSPQDIEQTKQLGKLLSEIDVTLIDHVIVTDDACISMKEGAKMDLFSPRLWSFSAETETVR